MELMKSVVWRLAERRESILMVVEGAAVALIVLDFVRVVGRLIGHRVPLGWDEAVYAVRARTWIDPEAPLVAWDAFRAPLVPLMATPAAAIAPDETALRLIGLLFGACLLILAWWLARSVAGPLAGVAVLIVLHSSPTLQQHSGYLLTDVPSAAMLLGSTALIWREFEMRQRLGPGLAAAAILCGLAFFTRYGVGLLIAPLLVLAGALWWRRILDAPRWPFIAGAIGAAFVILHLALSLWLTGSPLGILQQSYAAVPAWPSSPPRVMFEQWMRLELAGTTGRLAVIVGFVAVPIAAGAAIFSADWRRTLRAMILVSALGVWQVVILVFGSPHIEQRYFVFAIVTLVAAGVVVVGKAITELWLPARVLAVAAFVAFALIHRGPAVDLSLVRTLSVGGYYEPYRVAAEAIGHRAPDGCRVFGGGGPIVSWYSGCSVVPADEAAIAVASSSRELLADWLLIVGPPETVDGSTPAIQAAVDAATRSIPIQHPDSGATVATVWALAR